jgi:hypothetical protein
MNNKTLMIVLVLFFIIYCFRLKINENFTNCNMNMCQNCLINNKCGVDNCYIDHGACENCESNLDILNYNCINNIVTNISENFTESDECSNCYKKIDDEYKGNICNPKKLDFATEKCKSKCSDRIKKYSNRKENYDNLVKKINDDRDYICKMNLDIDSKISHIKDDNRRRFCKHCLSENYGGCKAYCY